ncbi:ribosome hibernation-promoting factor, HPF/YfiA family [Olsenella uli]|uniref:ribosome hibernation-promoting factor, HPF/YfiA family n=1 Tax=Olsenella uli TaxID=133926 RepID=UPI0012AC49BF|nr:ribosome-associated translation inhibitor RaiA [Olsenella uli]
MDIKVSGRKVTVTDALHDYVDEKIGDALKVFNIQPMTCDVVLRVEKNRSNPEAAVCEVTVRVRDNVVRVESADPDMYAAIDFAADKVTRQLRKFKTRVVDRRQRAQGLPVEPIHTDLADLIEPEAVDQDADDELVREKVIDLPPMTEEEALVQTDLIGHDFYVFTNATTGLVNVIYHRKNGGYGIIKPKIEEPDE